MDDALQVVGDVLDEYKRHRDAGGTARFSDLQLRHAGANLCSMIKPASDQLLLARAGARQSLMVRACVLGVGPGQGGGLRKGMRGLGASRCLIRCFCMPPFPAACHAMPGIPGWAGAAPPCAVAVQDCCPLPCQGQAAGLQGVAPEARCPTAQHGACRRPCRDA
jgi:hypothetical protein